jgi:hypothetical protein
MFVKETQCFVCEVWTNFETLYGRTTTSNGLMDEYQGKCADGNTNAALLQYRYNNAVLDK